MTLVHRLFIALFALAALCEGAVAAEAARAHVMLVGTYHFSNPAKDLNNVKAVDIVYGLDVDGDFPFDAVVGWAREHGRAAEIDAMLAAGASVQLVEALGYLAET
jgi:hypothetical protein